MIRAETIAVISRWFFAAVLFLTADCSIYFNTFYNAETSFREAKVIHQKVLRNYPDSIVVEPPADAAAKYDRAIDKASKVLDVYPKDKKWHDDALFLLGQAYFYKKEFSRSIRRMRQLQEEYPQSNYVPESYLCMARDYIGQEELARAEETVKFVLDRYPALDKDQEVSLLLVEIAIRREGTAQAIVLLEKALSGVRSAEKKQELLLRISELYMGLRQYDKAITLLEKGPRNKKDALREYRIDRNIVLCYVEVDSLAGALSRIKIMLADKRYVPYVKEILFVKGTILAHQGRTDEAIAVFKLVVGAMNDSALVKTDTSLTVGRALFELGRLYQKKKGSYREAEKYYRLVNERGVKDSSVAPIADKRLKAMQKLTELRSKLASKDTAVDRMKVRFTIGELFYYELDEPDSSFRIFSGIVAAVPKDSLYTPKALCAAASIARRDRRDTLLSDSLYKKLIVDYPGSDFIRQAQREMRSSDTLKTRKEKAAESFRSAEKTWLNDNNIKAAVQMFYDTYKLYSDLDIAPKSLFVAAWLVDNELQKKKTAQSLYEKICARYPSSLYCKDEAQPRLKTVIDTLEALRRQRKEATGDTAKSAGVVQAAKSTGKPAAAGDSSAGPSMIDSLDGATVIKDDMTAAVKPPSTVAGPDTGDAFTRRPQYRGGIPGRGVATDSLQKK